MLGEVFFPYKESRVTIHIVEIVEYLVKFLLVLRSSVHGYTHNMCITMYRTSYIVIINSYFCCT